MFVSPIIPQEPHDQFASNFELRRNTEMFLAWFRDSKLSESTVIRKKNNGVTMTNLCNAGF